MKNFLNFVREQGVVGLAVGFLLGGAISKVVNSLIQDILNPILGLLLGVAGGFEKATLKIGGAEILYGHFINVLIDFAIIAAVVYVGVKKLGLDKIDRKKV